MRWETIFHLWWTFSALKALSSYAQWPDASGAGQGAASFAGMMANGLGGFGAQNMMSAMAGGYPGASAGLGAPPSAPGLMGMGLGMQGFGASQLAALGGLPGGLGGLQAMAPPMLSANPMMSGQSALNALNVLGGLGGGMDMLQQQLGMPRFAPPGAGMPGPMSGYGMQGGQGGFGGGMPMNLMNGAGGMGGMNSMGMNSFGGGMGANPMGQFGGNGFQQGMGGQSQVFMPQYSIMTPTYGQNFGFFHPMMSQGAWGGGMMNYGLMNQMQQPMMQMQNPIMQMQNHQFQNSMQPGANHMFGGMQPSPFMTASTPLAYQPMNSASNNMMFGKKNMYMHKRYAHFQFLKKRKRSNKSGDVQNHDAAHIGDTKLPFSSVVDALKQASKATDDDDIDSQEATSCGGCIPLDLRKITGFWTQIYGNPESLRSIYTSLGSLPSSTEPDERSASDQQTTMPSIEANRNDTSIQPACVGFHFERPFPRRVSDAILGEAPVSLHFKDDKTYKLYQVSGMVRQSLIPNQSEVRLRISTVDIPLCLIKGGPTTSGDYDYAVFMETRGAHRCKALHVIARNSDTYFRTYSSDVIEFLQQKVKANEANPVRIMPNPEQCEPRQQQQQQQDQPQVQDKEGSS